jgi:ribonuclease HI
VGKKQAKQVELECRLDSELIVKQLNHKYKISKENTQRYFIEVWNLMLDFGKVTFVHVPREQNKIADEMVNKALDGEIGQGSFL